MPGIFITGTDTGIGKTYITLLLANYFMGEGIDVGIMKPISAGPQKENDALYLKKRLKLKDPISLINPVHLNLPLAPYVAAAEAKTKINLKEIFRAFKKLESLHELILVEGVGGVLVPIKKDYFVADMIKDFGLSTIIVARAGLGTINHTLLTIEALKQRKINIFGIIMNGFNGQDLSEKTNVKMIEELSGIRVIAQILWKG